MRTAGQLGERSSGMIVELTCYGCDRPGRERGVSVDEAQGTVSLSGGRCRTCGRDGEWGPRVSGARGVDRRGFEPHRIAVAARRPVDDLVLFPRLRMSRQCA